MNQLLPEEFRHSAISWSAFVLVLGLGLALLAILLLSLGYADSFLWAHQSWGAIFDLSMPHLTHLADGATVGGLLILIQARKHPKLMLALLLSLVLVLIVVNVLKQQIFADWDRPVGFLGEDQVRELSMGKERYFSFPSGHSTAAACLGWYIATMYPRFFWGVASAMFALFLAWTRVYIGVHFPGDILAGLALGTFIAWVGTWVIAWIDRNRHLQFLEKSGRGKLLLQLIGLGLMAGGIVSLLTKYYL